MNGLKYFLSILGAIFFFPNVPAAVHEIPVASQLDRGWYDALGNASPTNSEFGFGGNYTVGRTETEVRNFFVFQIPTLPAAEKIVRADFVIYCTPSEDGGYVSPDTNETFVLHSIDRTAIETLRARDTNAASTNVFEDLGDGTAFNTPATFTPDSQDTEVTIPLNEAFLALLTNHFGGELAFGGSINSLQEYSAVPEFLFGYSHHVPFDRTRLVITTTSIPLLSIERRYTSELQISWPADFRYYVLEESDFLNPPNWTPVELQREISNGQITVTIEPSAPQKFFRLRPPQPP
jgi:hypothetical protein